MSEHSELVIEMAVLEKMSTQDRLKLAKKRRLQQLKKWSQREKEFKSRKRSNIDLTNRINGNNKCDYKVHFVPSVMLLESAARNDVEEVKRLLMLGVSPDSTNEDGLTALHQCCIDDSEDMMKLLISFNANVNAKDSEQWTPLHAAATCGHLHLVKFLIAKQANLLAVNADGNMPYDICEDELTLDYIESEMAKRGITQDMIDEKRSSTERLMLSDLKHLVELEGNDKLESRDGAGATPLHIAAANGYTTVIEYLLDQNVSTDVMDNDLWQPVHAAACWGHPDALEVLVLAGADLNAMTKNGETPLDICEDPELKERIIQLKSEMDTKRLHHSNRLRRTHSQNTRSQSVRRTSIREKNQISRREARQEARLRQDVDAAEAEQQPVTVRDVDDDDDNEDNNVKDDAVVIMNNCFEDVSLKENRASFTGPESVKVEIHVTVNTSPNQQQQANTQFNGSGTTLSDLKKQRSDQRLNRGSLSSSTTESSNNINTLSSLPSLVDNNHENKLLLKMNPNYDPPPSPTHALKTFRGDPSEVVGETKQKGCCFIM